MDFAFVVVCKVPNQNAKSKNRPSPRDFANGLDNYSIWRVREGGPGARVAGVAFAKSSELCINAKLNLRIAKFAQMQN
jgi:hypothetical protein